MDFWLFSPAQIINTIVSGIHKWLNVNPSRIGFLLFLFGFALYLPTVTYDFAWDDAIVITENPRVQNGFAQLGDHWKMHQSDRLHDRYGFRPIVLTSFAIEYGIWGANPGLSHAMNALYYGFLCWIIFAFLTRAFPNLPIIVPALITALFAVHPVHVEVVANIKSRDEIFALGFSLLSIISFLQFYQTRKILAPFLCILFFALSLLSKESSLMMIPVFAGVIWVQAGGKWQWKLAIMALPLALGVIGLVYIRTIAAPSGVMEITQGAGLYHENPALANPYILNTNSMVQFWGIFTIPLRYILLFIFPWPLSYYYGYNQVPILETEQEFSHLGQGVLFVWATLAIVYYKRDKIPAFTLLFFVSTIFLLTHFLGTLPDFMADRFLFTPSLALCIFFVWGILKMVNYLIKRFQVSVPQKTPAPFISLQNAGFLVIILISLVYGGRTVGRMPSWRNNLALFSGDIAHQENCAKCHYYYAGALVDEAQKQGSLPPKQSEAHYRKAIEISPLVYNARIELAQILYNQNRFQEGIKVMEACRKQFPDAPRPWYFLGYGQYFHKDYSAAIQSLETADRLAPLRSDAPFYLCWSYYFAGKPESAIHYAQICLVRFPAEIRFRDALSDFYFGSQQPEKGFEVLKTAIQSYPDPVLYRKIIQRYNESNLPEEAEKARLEAKQKGIQL